MRNQKVNMSFVVLGALLCIYQLTSFNCTLSLPPTLPPQPNTAAHSAPNMTTHGPSAAPSTTTISPLAAPFNFSRGVPTIPGISNLTEEALIRNKSHHPTNGSLGHDTTKYALRSLSTETLQCLPLLVTTPTLNHPGSTIRGVLILYISQFFKNKILAKSNPSTTKNRSKRVLRVGLILIEGLEEWRRHSVPLQ